MAERMKKHTFYTVRGELGDSSFNIAITSASAEVLKANLTYPGFLVLEDIHGEEVLIKPECIKIIQAIYIDKEENHV